MIFQLAALFLTGLFKGLPLASGMHKKIKAKLRLQHKLDVDFKSIRIGFNSVVVKQLVFVHQAKGISVSAGKLVIKLNFFKLHRPTGMIAHVGLHDGKISRIARQSSSPGPAATAPIEKKIQRLYRIIGQRMQQLLKICPATCELVNIEISPLKAFIGKLQLTSSFTFDPAALSISAVSGIRINHLDFTGSFDHRFNGKDPVLLGLKLAPCTIEEMFASFPEFHYPDLYTASYKGKFAFDSKLKIQPEPPYKNSFRVSVDKDLSIDNPGKLDFSYLERSFVHTVWDDGRAVKKIILDESYAEYVPASKVCDYFKKAVVLAEDRNFYNHKGVDADGIGFAIVSNLASSKISRGASTITMQLMRNLFLHHERSMVKKAEEVLLAWLAEEVFSIRKERILEIYLNIIEFGPDIYGIKEASDFYFGKTPAQLSLTESLVMTYIVPRPKFFLDAVEKGSLILSQNLKKHIEHISTEMLKKEFITKEEFDSIGNEIQFANGLGSIQLRDNIDNLHDELLEIFTKASRLWTSRYTFLPRPFVSCTYRSPEKQDELYNRGRLNNAQVVTNARAGQSPHNFHPSFAFDVAFKDQYGQMDWNESLFERFAELVSEIDEESKIIWGGNFKSIRDIPHFELKGWKEVAV